MPVSAKTSEEPYFFPLTDKTGHGALRMTSSVVEPKRTVPRRLRGWTPITSKSA